MQIIVLLPVMLMACRMVQAQLWYPLYLPHPAATAQYHAQDSLGQVNFGYAGDNQFRAESRLVDGSVRGSYSYVDPTRRLIHVVYLADSDGFRVVGGNNLPTVPATPPTPPPPQPVDYTPEVAAARAEFEKIFNELAAQNSKAAEAKTEATEPVERRRRRRSVLLPALYTLTPGAAAIQVKVTEGKEVADVISPANTKAIEFSQVEKSIPLAPLAPVVVPYSTVPHYGYIWVQRK